VELNVIDESSETTLSPLLIHPDWTLAAWSVDRNGIVNGTRGSAIKLIKALEGWLYYGDAYQDSRDFINIHMFMTVQALSMVPYSTTQAPPSGTNALPQALDSKAQVYVWTYGLDSRSSKFGVVVMILGCICIVARSFLYQGDMKDATEILITILKRNPALPKEWPNEEQEFPVVAIDDTSQLISFRG
jgi:hypothetical protein